MGGFNFVTMHSILPFFPLPRRPVHHVVRRPPRSTGPVFPFALTPQRRRALRDLTVGFSGLDAGWRGLISSSCSYWTKEKEGAAAPAN